MVHLDMAGLQQRRDWELGDIDVSNHAYTRAALDSAAAKLVKSGGTNHGNAPMDNLPSSDASKVFDHKSAVTREKLFEEVWAEPMTTVCKRYGVSSGFMARVCTRMNVPRPAVGYWARLAVGKAGPRPTLPEPRPQDELAWSRDGTPAPVSRVSPRPPDPDRPRLHVPRQKRSAEHPLLKGVEKHFEVAHETRLGYLKPRKQLMVDVVASKAALSNALALAKTLFSSLEQAGHTVVIPPHEHHLSRAGIEEREESVAQRHHNDLWSPMRPTVVFIGTLAIGLTIVEMSKVTELRYVNGDFLPLADPAAIRARRLPGSWTTKRETPCGRLCLQAYSPYWRAPWARIWREKKRGELDTMVKRIVQQIESEAPMLAGLVAEGMRQADIERQKWEEQQERWRIEEAASKQAKALHDSKEELASIIEQWDADKRVERFFDEAAAEVDELADPERHSLTQRLHLARQLLGGTNALRRLEKWKTPAERG